MIRFIAKPTALVIVNKQNRLETFNTLIKANGFGEYQRKPNALNKTNVQFKRTFLTSDKANDFNDYKSKHAMKHKAQHKRLKAINTLAKANGFGECKRKPNAPK